MSANEFRCRACGAPLVLESESEFCLFAAEQFCPACERAYAAERDREPAPPGTPVEPRSAPDASEARPNPGSMVDAGDRARGERTSRGGCRRPGAPARPG